MILHRCKNLGVGLFVFILCFVFSISSQANPIQEIFQQGMIEYGNGNYQEAIKLFEKTLQMYPNLHPSYNYIALSKKALGADTYEVVELLKKAIEIKSDYAEPFENLSKIYYAEGKFDLSIENGLKSLEYDPESSSAMLTVAWTYLLGLGKAEDAIYYFEKAIKEDHTPYTKFGLGMAYLQVDQKYKALDMITQLRVGKSDELANKLENLLHQDQKLPTRGLQSFAAESAKPVSKKGVLVEDLKVQATSSNKTLSADGMKVRLRQPQELTPEQFPYGAQEEPLSGTERIRRLQNKGSY